MKKIMIMVLLASVAFATPNWQAELKVNHADLSRTYVKAVKSKKEASELCKESIEMAHYFKDHMNTSDKDKVLLEHYIFTVKTYCSLLAGCNNCYK